MVDLSASSVSGLVNTSSGQDVRIGSSYDGSNRMSGALDEIRVSKIPRGLSWASYSFENQKPDGKLLSFDLQHQALPTLPADLNLTIVQGFHSPSV